MYQAVVRFCCINALLSILQIHTELAPLAWSLAILTKTSWKTSNKIPLLMKCIRLWEDFVSTLLYPVSLLIGGWDWVQGGNPLYAAVKCLSDRRGQIWRIFFNFFAKSTCHIHFPGGIFFVGSKKNFSPSNGPFFGGHRHFSKIEGPGWPVRGPLLYINLYALGST